MSPFSHATAALSKLAYAKTRTYNGAYGPYRRVRVYKLLGLTVWRWTIWRRKA